MSATPRRLDDAELFDWLRLARSDNVGPRTFAVLLSRFGSARAVLEALPGLVKRAGARPIRLAAAADVEREIAVLRRAGLTLLPCCDPAYPALLRQIDAPPPVLIVRGQAAALARPMVAVVGSRNASAAGLMMTERLARGVGAAGYVVVSGLARGIDTRAHLASLDSGTVGVLAGGHDRLYPSENAGLAARMAENGAVISEMPFAWDPRGRDFPRRNRIVSGLALGTIVVEAAQRSGSLITARFASEQGRTVFAVPGSPLDPRAEGTNALIRDGAILCGSVDHVLDDLAPMIASAAPHFSFNEVSATSGAFWDETDLLGDGGEQQPEFPGLGAAGGESEDRNETARPTESSDRLMDLIGVAPIAVDEIVRLSGLATGTVQSLLVDLELSGSLVRTGVGTVARRPQ